MLVFSPAPLRGGKCKSGPLFCFLPDSQLTLFPRARIGSHVLGRRRSRFELFQYLLFAFSFVRHRKTKKGTSFIVSPLLPAHLQGTSWNGLIHAADWFGPPKRFWVYHLIFSFFLSSRNTCVPCFSFTHMTNANKQVHNDSGFGASVSQLDRPASSGRHRLLGQHGCQRVLAAHGNGHQHSSTPQKEW